MDTDQDGVPKRRMKQWIRANRHLPGRQFVKELNRKLVGHYNYFGIRSNEKAMGSFFTHAIECAFKWLNRRGGKRRSFNWPEFKAAMKKLNVATPRIVEKQRNQRRLIPYIFSPGCRHRGV